MTRRSLFGTFLAPIAAKFFPPPPKKRFSLVVFRRGGWDVARFDNYQEAFNAAMDLKPPAYAFSVHKNYFVARVYDTPRRHDVGAEKSTRLPGPQGSPPPA